MVTSEDLRTRQQFSSWNIPLPASNGTSLLQLGQNHNLTQSPHSNLGVGFPPCSVLPNLNSVQPNGVDGFNKGLPCSSPFLHPRSEDSQCALPYGFGFSPSTGKACQKRFLVVDQCKSQTRLFFNPFFSHPQNGMVSLKTCLGVDALCNEKLEKQPLLRPIVEEKSNENNHLTDEGSEMHEDTKEIDALLYSDSDDEYDDEVTSGPHTLFDVGVGVHKDVKFEEPIEEVGSSDGSTKRQRLVDGRYKLISSSLVDPSPLNMATSRNYQDDAESSVAHVMKPFEDSNYMKRLEKVNLCESLKILKSIIPRIESDNPLAIIDKAIDYLKMLKDEVS